MDLEGLLEQHRRQAAEVRGGGSGAADSPLAGLGAFSPPVQAPAAAALPAPPLPGAAGGSAGGGGGSALGKRQPETIEEEGEDPPEEDSAGVLLDMAQDSDIPAAGAIEID